VDEFDYEAEFQRLAATDEDFEDVRQAMRETIELECPDRAGEFASDYETFLRGYAAVKKAKFTRFDADLVERSRKGDIDASAEMLIKAGIIDSLKEK
jgi:hypothetical protein